MTESSMTLTIQLFGPYATAAGDSSVTLAFKADDAVTASKVVARLGRDYPPLKPLLDAAKLAVNFRYVAQDHQVTCEDELALIGLVGGG